MKIFIKNQINIKMKIKKKKKKKKFLIIFYFFFFFFFFFFFTIIIFIINLYIQLPLTSNPALYPFHPFNSIVSPKKFKNCL